MSSRKFILKEFSQPAASYVGRRGEVWFQEGTTTVRFGDDITPGGVPLGGGGIAGPTTTCAPGATTVVFTASSSSVRTLKVTAQVVGFETGVIDFVDTHSADIIAIKNIRTGLGESSVYGVTYTSVGSLVTFDAAVVGGVLCVTATPTSLTNPITVNSIGIEIEA